MSKRLPKADIGRNQNGYFIFDIDTFKRLTQYFPTKRDAVEEFEEFEDERWVFGKYDPFYRPNEVHPK